NINIRCVTLQREEISAVTRKGNREVSEGLGGRRDREERMRNPLQASASGSGSGTAAAGKAKVTQRCSKVDLRRGAWTAEEDEVLSSFIRREGEGKWRTLPRRAGLQRCGKSCRLRWMNYLRPSVKRGRITPDEEDLILRLHRLLGNRWALIAGRLPGRTDNEIKNYWNSHLSKKLVSQGIDPRTHKPLGTYDKHSPSLEKHDNTHASDSPPTAGGNLNPSIYLQNTSSSLGHPDHIGSAYSNMVIQEDLCDYSDEYNLGNGGEWQVFDGTKATTTPSCQVGGGALEIDDNMDCCTDDVFSSFLSSLVDDDMFQQRPENNIIGSVFNSTHHLDLASPSEFLVSGDPAFANEQFWEPAAIYSTASNEENRDVHSTNHMDKQL
ncbi:hypothetical protein Taro_044028, partial [Colocasia esculenta]|nr:hypothetical protein [Colocasia esculenta]